MKPNFKERMKEAGRLISITWAATKSIWARDRRVAREVVYEILKHLKKFWLALEDIFPSMGNARQFWFGVIKKFYYDDCFSYAASLSFWLLISLAPLATLFFKLLVVFMGGRAFYQQTLDTLSNVIPYLPVSFLEDTVNHSLEIGNSMGFVWGVLIFGSYWGVNQLDTSLAHVFGVRINKERQTRKNPLLRQIALLVGGVVVLALVLAWLLSGAIWKYLPRQQSVLLNHLPIIICLILTTLIFQFIPRVHVAFRHAFLGGLVTTFFWAAAKWTFRIYVDHAFTWGIMYGSFLGIIAGLTFLYYTCAILLFGAEITAEFCLRKENQARKNDQ
jgi:membrane protein